MIRETQIPEQFKRIIDDEVSIYSQATSITVKNSIPDTDEIPIVNKTHWLRIPDVICVYVDMLNSTKLSASNHDKTTAKAHRLFSNTAVKLFHEFESPYIDVKGDGVFALFNLDQIYTALAAAVTFKTFAREEFTPKVRDLTDVEVGCHIGIDQKTVLVRKIGIKRMEGRTDRQNEVWAGKPVNMAAKLAGMSEDNQLLVSDRYYKKLQSDLVRLSCGCGSENGEKKLLWEEIDIANDDKFDFDKAYSLKSSWCPTHGKEYCEKILVLDDE